MKIGEIFLEQYPFEAVEWCNENNATIVEIEAENEVRRFQIVEIVCPDYTVDEIKNQLNDLDLKSIRALRAGDEEYIQKYEDEAVELRKKLKDLE